MIVIFYVIDGELQFETLFLLCGVQILFVLLGILIFLFSYAWLYLQKRGKQVSQVVMVWIWQGKAYLPTLVEVKSGDFVETSPIHIAPLTQKDLAVAIESVANMEPQHKPPQDDEEDPLLIVTNATSREELVMQAIIFIVQWSEKRIYVDIADVQSDTLRRVQSFHSSVSLATISSTILEAVWNL